MRVANPSYLEKSGAPTPQVVTAPVKRCRGHGGAGRPGGQNRGSARDVVDTVVLADDAPAGGFLGWLSITGRSIETRASERLFVAAGRPPVPGEEHHHALWHAVLAS